MDAHKTLLYPMMGEKATGMREKENKLTFIVDKKATKKDVKEAIELLYKVKVVKVDSINTIDGKKKIHAKLDAKFSAEEIASHFGVL